MKTKQDLKNKNENGNGNGDNVPQESETIAVKRTARLAGKIRKTKEAVSFRPGRWSVKTTQSVSLGLIWFLNLYLVFPFFGTEAFVTSYSGPIIPALARVISWFNLPLLYAIEIVNIGFFLALPVTFYLLIKKISGSYLVALLSGLLVSLPISPFAGARAGAVFFSVEGPHMASLAVVPLATYGLLLFLHDGGLKNLILASVASALVGLISPFGLLTFFLFAAVVVFSEILLGNGRLKLSRLMLVLVLTGGFSSFWYNPGFFFWLVTGPMGQEVRVMINRLIPISFFVLPLLGAFGYLLFDRKPKLQPLFLATFIFISLLVVVTVGRGLVPSGPSRYIPEIGLALAFLISILVEMGFEFLMVTKKNIRLWRFKIDTLVNALMLLVILGLSLVVVQGRSRVLAFDTGVLGFFSGVERGQIWLEREKFSGFSSFLGYLITLATMTALTVLSFKSKLVARKKA